MLEARTFGRTRAVERVLKQHLRGGVIAKILPRGRKIELRLDLQHGVAEPSRQHHRHVEAIGRGLLLAGDGQVSA